jgi:hypothetical protein
MNLYYIDSGTTRFYSKKTDAEEAARKEADKIQRTVMVSRMFIAIDRDNVTRMANGEIGFTKFVGRICAIEPRKRPKLKLKRIAAALALLTSLLLPNPSDASSSCTTRKSGSITTTSCWSKTSYSQCRSYRSGSVVKTYCR